MTDKMMMPSDWPNRMRPQDPVKQLFDRVFEKHPPRNVSADGSTVATSRWIPQVDIKEEAHRFILYVDAPGVAPDAVDVRMEQGMLIIKGARKTESQEGRESFLRVEREYGAFHRCFALPDSADPRNIIVTARDGILYIVVRKRPDRASPDIRIAKGDMTYGATPFNPPWRVA
jgi:HSP20 family protein